MDIQIHCVSEKEYRSLLKRGVSFRIFNEEEAAFFISLFDLPKTKYYRIQSIDTIRMRISYKYIQTEVL